MHTRMMLTAMILLVAPAVAAYGQPRVVQIGGGGRGFLVVPSASGGPSPSMTRPLRAHCSPESCGHGRTSWSAPGVFANIFGLSWAEGQTTGKAFGFKAGVDPRFWHGGYSREGGCDHRRRSRNSDLTASASRRRADKYLQPDPAPAGRNLDLRSSLRDADQPDPIFSSAIGCR